MTPRAQKKVYDDIVNHRSPEEQAAADINALPELVINESDPTATAIALAAMIAKRDDFLFNGHVPVRIAVEADCLPRAIEVASEAVRIYAHRICRPVRVRKIKGKVGCLPKPLTKDIASLYLNLEGEWNLPRFRGIVTSPILSADGSIRNANGYDAETGLWCYSIPRIKLADYPTWNEAAIALRALRMFFRTFPFADGERVFDSTLGVHVTDSDKPIGMDESTFLVALMTAVCRASLDFAPAFLARAPNISGAGTGKGYLAKAMAIIASGAKPAAFTGGHDKEEFEKRITSALVKAQPVVFLDNYNAKELRSDVLNSALTEDPSEVRPFGITGTVPLHTRAFVVITGNAVEIAEDLVRRVLVTDIDAGMENPELRPFAPGFLNRVFEARAELLAHILTIWRWGRQNEQRPGTPIGGYETWAQWCRDPLLALKCRDPADRIAEIKAADPQRRALIGIFDAYTMKGTDLAPEVIELIDQRAKRNEDGSLKYNRQWVAGWLERHGRTCLGGYTLKKTTDTARSRPVNYYTLTMEEKPSE